MAKRRDADDQPPLSGYWNPPPWLDGAAQPGVGEPIACLATTYEFKADFFETELLPRFLGLRFDNTENEPSFVVEREDHLARVRAAVLVDASRFDAGQSTLRWDQVPVRVPGGLLHAKVTLLRWDRLVRVIVGSANLNPQGYRRNRELFAVLDFWDGEESVALSVLREALDFLRLTTREWSIAAPAVRERTAAILDEVRQAVRRWSLAPRDFKPRERPSVSLSVTYPKRAGVGSSSALERLLEIWGNKRATLVNVVTPFVGQDGVGAGRDRVVEKLNCVSRTRDCEGYLVVPQLPSNDADERPRVGLTNALRQSWQDMFTPSQAFVLPTPPSSSKKGQSRDLHAKAVLLENEDDVLLMIGSSNFTPHGMGVGAFNVEANLLFLDKNCKRDGIFFADRLAGLSLDWDDSRPINDITVEEPKQPPEDAPVQGPIAPAFFKWATYSQESGILRLELDIEREEPAEWTASLPGETDVGSLACFSRGSRPVPLSSPTLEYVIATETRGVNVVALIVKWTDSKAERQSAALGVCAESPESLLPPEDYRKLGADDIIDCLISGKSPAQWFDGRQRLKSGEINTGVNDSLRAVDTSGYLLYRVRRFGRALAAMSQRIGETPPRADAIAYRLLKDPFGPVPLAEKIALVGDTTKPVAWLEVEQRAFLLAEVLRSVGLMRVRFGKDKGIRAKDRRAIDEPFQEAERRLSELIAAERAASSAPWPDNLEAYIKEIRKQLTNGEANVAAEVRDAS